MFWETPNMALAQNSVFARIEKPNVFFFNSPVDDAGYRVFEIPQSYFVELLGKAEDAEDLFYSARYLDVCGYVKKADVTPVQGVPQNPFASGISFRVFSLSGLDLKSTPSGDSPFNRIINVPYLCSDLIFYGTCPGQELIPDKNNLWYYCKYINGDSSYFGFLYSEFCDKLSPIIPNTEILPVFEGELFAKPTINQTNQSTNSAISNELKIFVIVAISLPCIFIVYLLFKPTKLVADDGKKSNKKIRRLKRSEFYELDD
ncbi:MAG: hypothetical protein IJ975_02070 [Clostridia bacterium]|nr:hypothetical protein [Clostridia bacterium]